MKKRVKEIINNKSLTKEEKKELLLELKYNNKSIIIDWIITILEIDNYIEYYNYIESILFHKEFIKRNNYLHHLDSVCEHSLKVSIMSFNMSKNKSKAFKKNVAIAGLLHDFYDSPWQTPHPKKPLLKKHGFTHAKEAYINAITFFPNLINDRILNSILRHMFPLNIIIPKYKEGWYITLADKIISLKIIKEYKYLLNNVKAR